MSEVRNDIAYLEQVIERKNERIEMMQQRIADQQYDYETANELLSLWKESSIALRKMLDALEADNTNLRRDIARHIEIVGEQEQRIDELIKQCDDADRERMALEKAVRDVVNAALTHSHLDGPVEQRIEALAALLEKGD